MTLAIVTTASTEADAANGEFADPVDTLPMRLDACEECDDDDDELVRHRRAITVERRVAIAILCVLCAVAGYLAGLVHAAGVLP